MPKLLRIKPSEVVPSQDWLKSQTVQFILDCYSQGRGAELPPPPLVRRDPDTGKLVAIDGHNLLAVADSLGKELDVYVVESAVDQIPTDDPLRTEMVEKRNKELRDKFDSVLVMARETATKGFHHFSDLARHSPELSRLLRDGNPLALTL